MKHSVSPPRQLEFGIESVIFSSRWLMAPFYLGLILTLALLLYHFIIQFFDFAINIHGKTEREVILGVLGLIDLSFVGNLILIVIFSGYENFVSRIEAGETDRPAWMTKIDFSGLKQKLMASIVAISAIEVLKGIMDLDEPNNTRLAWLVGVHAVFVVSLLLMAVSDRIGENSSAVAEHRVKKGPRS